MIKEICVSSKVIEYLVKSSGYTEDEIARKMVLDPILIRNFVEGKGNFTITQIRKLAEILKRPLVSFFIDEKDIPPEVPMPTDYRINRDERLSPNILLAKRRSYYLISNLKELTEKKSYIPEFEKRIPAAKLANEFRYFLKIEIEKTKNKSPKELLNLYKNLIEDKLSIPVIEYPFNSTGVRAFSIHSDLSLIVLNEDDISTVKLFSLFHEICHLLKNTDGICSIEFEYRLKGAETYCNNFSAEFLVPVNDLKNKMKKFGRIDENAIQELSKYYGVSKQVIILRLLNLGLIKIDFYEEYKKKLESIKEERPKFLRRSWEMIYFNRNGKLILSTIMNAYKKDNISLTEALGILDMKSKYFGNL